MVMPRIDESAARRARRAGGIGSLATCAVLTLAGCGQNSAPVDTAPVRDVRAASTSAHHARSAAVDPRPGATPAAGRQATHRVMAHYVAASTTMLASPQRHRPPDRAVTGPARAALEALRDEYASEHYRVVGRPRVVSEHVVRRTPGRIVLAVCLDNSTVHVVGRNGRPVPAPASAARSLNLLTLARQGHRWTVVDTGFPNDPRC